MINLKKIMKKKLTKTRNIILMVSIFMIIGYTAVAFALQFVTDSQVISDTLTEQWFKFWSVTIFTNCGITIAKTVKGSTNSDDDE